MEVTVARSDASTPRFDANAAGERAALRAAAVERAAGDEDEPSLSSLTSASTETRRLAMPLRVDALTSSSAARAVAFGRGAARLPRDDELSRRTTLNVR